ncbi:hypothetical protein CCP3SC5AM1_130035 [Gammaproteobacteria bacterium]
MNGIDSIILSSTTFPMLTGVGTHETNTISNQEINKTRNAIANQETTKMRVAESAPSARGCSCRACLPSNGGTNADNRIESTQDESASSAAGDRSAVSEDVGMIKKLKDRDKEVRAHEAAHLAVAGGLARGGARFSYQRGPDDQFYAIGGEVTIDTSPVSGDPEATLGKARTIRAAALAPSEPSGQDQMVAAVAIQMARKAEKKIAEKHNDEITNG